MEKYIPKSFRQFLALLLCVVMLVPMIPTAAFATEGEAEQTSFTRDGETPLAIVYAASDFQPYSGSADDVDSGKAVMTNIIDTMQSVGKYTAVNGALICGDYSKVYNDWTKVDVSKNNAGLAAVADVLKTEWKLDYDDVVYVQGNHDPATTKGLDASGNNDTANYGVYVLHEDDFQWKQGDDTSDKVSDSGNADDAKTATKETAAELRSYLKAKADEKYDKPIFVCAHVPLHFSYRTSGASNQDNIYAEYIFDVLNEYGKKLDIIFLFGHNHSKTYDDYIGGAAVYLPVGHTINVPSVSNIGSYTQQTLTFTYMNAGYLGYYNGKCATGLSSTIFEIYDDKVIVARYDEDSIANLKDKGKLDTSNDTWSGAAADETVYASTQTIKLKEQHADLDLGLLATGMLIKGTSAELSINGVYGTTYSVDWSSSETSVATVASSGDGMSATVNAVGLGKTKITAVLTEETKTRAAGDVTTLDVEIEVVDNTASAVVTLLPAGTHTYFQKTDTMEIGETYAIIDIENEGSVIGRQQALHYNADIDSKREGDTNSEAKRELNTGSVTVFQLPVNGETATLVKETNENLWWTVEAAKDYGSGGWFTIKTYKDRTYDYLAAGEGDDNFLTKDSDMDRINTTNDPSGAGGGHWRYNSLRGLYSGRKADGFQYVLYYSQANTDFSAYRINHNGSAVSSDLDGEKDSAGNYKYRPLEEEEADSRVYLFEKLDITLDNPIYAQLNDTTGYVNKDVGYTDGSKRLGGAQTGDTIILTNGDTKLEIPVTIDMLSGTFDVTTPGTYTGLTVTYAGVKVVTEGYTLVVRNSATLLKNDAARDYMDTIYTLATELVPGRQYLVVDSNEAGIAHAMGVYSNTVVAHNVLVQGLPVDGKEMLYIDSSRYSDAADETAVGLVGRDIKDQGNINEYLNSTVDKTDYQRALRLVWTVTQRMFTTDGNPEYSDVRRNDRYFLLSQLQVSKGTPERLLSIAANAEDTQLTLLSEAYTNGSSDVKVADRWWDQWQYDADEYGLHLESAQVPHAYLFYNWQNIIGSVAGGAATKNFQTEEATSGETTKFTHTGFRRTWIYERVTNIDTISARVSDLTGRVVEDKNASSFTEDYILVDTTHADGTVTTEQVPITVSMLSGTLDLNTPGTYTKLTVTYQGVVVTDDYKLVVTKAFENDYPEFPDEGAVRIDKQLDTTKYNYLETGAASIDLSVTGIPAQTGVDLVIILDASSSMQRCPHSIDQGSDCSECGVKIGAEHSRMALLENTLQNMLEQLQEPIDGYVPDVSVAIATFNGYTPINTDYELWHSGTKKDDTTTALTHAQSQQADEDRPDSSQLLLPFTDAADVNAAQWNATKGVDILYNKGTNYDRGMEIAYDLLKAKQDQNAMNGVTRDAIVVFMSDGAPFQFNYFQGDPQMVDWADYLNGSLTTGSACVTAQSEAVQAAFAKYYDGGKHWLAEAVKADPNSTKKIIDPDAMTKDHITYINGLGATLYTIGFGLAEDNSVDVETCETVLTKMATDADHYLRATNGEQLEEAFSRVTGKILKAGNAVFTDQMGTNFDMITSNVHSWTVIDEKGNEVTQSLTFNPAPSVVVKEYELYKRSEIGKTLSFNVTAEDGTIISTKTVTVTETMVGVRKPVDPAELEVVTFSNDGTQAYSDQVDVNGDGICDDQDNIKNDGVICAATFWYNDTQNSVMIDTDRDGTAETSLEKECFYWNVGDIPQDELVLSYDVYLTGSMEGTRPAGNYDTNTHAELNYVNYLGNDCTLSVPTPKLPWNQATVGYGFYLVDKFGNPIINQSTGKIGSFEQSVRITQPVYETFLLNSDGGEMIASNISASGVLPEGYELYDSGAAYSVTLSSNGEGYYIVYTDSATGAQTTYVVGVSSGPVTTDPERAFDQTLENSTSVGQKTTTGEFATANTIVWFAVTAVVQCAPDTVVIDYGLPVNIDVMTNDVLMGNYGALEYIGATSTFADGYAAAKESDADLKLWEYLQDYSVNSVAAFETVSLTHGENGVLNYGDAKVSDGKVQYTLDTMQMNAEETFVYAVDYTGSVGTQGYYYSTVTVIPATTIYYEDNFITYKVYDYVSDEDVTNVDVTVSGNEKYANNKWSVDGNRVSAVQGQDRPGEYSLPEVDANNIYGYDGAYTNMAAHSMGSAMKVTVDADVYAEATFTFWGTGFDVVSLTSSDSGTLLVDVYDAEDFATYGYAATPVEYHMVDTYYGYKWDGENWVADQTASDCLYQVPVMKINGLDYDQYTVVISASYQSGLDHNTEDASYDFYLDAIRIYDPANDGADSEVIEDAYVADGEGWPEYFELRNLIISKKDFDALETGNQTNGIIFIDNTVDDEYNVSYSISDYTNYGPNNELYLAPGQSIAFNLAIPDDVAGIHLAMKTVGDGSADVKVYNANDKKQTNVIPNAIATATDLYYDITSLNNKTVVISNSETSGVILSITNIKVTYESEHEDSIEAGFFTTTTEGAQEAVVSLMMMRPSVEPDDTVPETPTPEVPEEPAVFAPEKLSVRLSDSSVKVGSKVTVTVTTSTDVDYITINGTKVTNYIGGWYSNSRTWLIRVEAEEVGEMDVAVVCYNSEGLASLPVMESVTVTAQYTSITNVVKDLVTGFFDRLWGRR